LLLVGLKSTCQVPRVRVVHENSVTETYTQTRELIVPAYYHKELEIPAKSMDNEASTKCRDLPFNGTCQQKYGGLFSREPVVVAYHCWELAVLANLWKNKI
jgi:hypothetical protein